MLEAREAGGVRPLSSVLKTLQLLDLLGKSDRPMKLMELAAASGSSRATTYQKLLTLVEAGWLEQTEQGSYRLSLHAALVGETALVQANLGERFAHVMQELVLQVGETASLAVLNGNCVRLVRRVEAQQVAVRADVKVGTLLSLNDSSSGRVLTAFSSPAYREMLQRQGAVLARPALLKEIAARGYAVSEGTDTPGVQSVAMPVFDAKGACIAALSLVTPASRFDPDKLIGPLREAVQTLSQLK
ncbi:MULTISPECIES: IclR family transcriptional regulator [Pigmentiphaga]|uniref:IclR family transcriptional regulator n=1 Tax=Pigmentiphaga daeguensis TaxID=414049 RepID=A0ABN1CYA6_9BURK|nr:MULTISPECIES: IclR family transcriptional regulator [unclassified Pigmentiphaga]OVZ58942.1 hypothetical protein CDO46_24565 [Pigmentiphaga sp. NML030171]